MSGPENRFEAYALARREKVLGHVRTYLARRTAGLPGGMKRCLMEYPMRPGKALRPVFILLFNDGFGGPRGRAEKVAATCQLLADWGLGRDDLADSAELRRGAPTLHKKYGFDVALNALDLLHSCVYDMLCSYCALPRDLYDRVLAEFMRAENVTLGGQHLEFEIRRRPLETFTRAQYMRVAAAKTSYHAIIAPAVIGSLLGGYRGTAEPLRKFGTLAGTAFQLADDALDVVNDGSGGFGKAVANDIYEGKRTLLLLEALRRLPAGQAARVRALYRPGRPRSRAEALWVRERILSTGAVQTTLAEARTLAARALAVFDSRLAPLLRGPYADHIRLVTASLAERTR